MKQIAHELIQRLLPLSQAAIDQRANCFNAVQLIFRDALESKFLAPEEFVGYIQRHFSQSTHSAPGGIGHVAIVWSRSNSEHAVGKIQIDKLVKHHPSYPFGLIIEHSFVSIGDGFVFQKRDPSAFGPYEVITISEAIEPSLRSPGFEITYHIRTPRN